MLLIICVGILCGKLRLIDLGGAGQLSELLLKVVVPCVILKSFLMPFDKEKFTDFLIACLLGFLAHFLCIVVGAIFFRNRPCPIQQVERFALTFSNCGFMAIPIISAVGGAEGVFFSSAFLIANNALTWSYGVALMSSERKISLRKCFLNPAIISIIIGFILFTAQIPLPGVMQSAIGFLDSMNTPLAMVIIGVYIYHANVFNGLKKNSVYLVSILRLLVAPLLMICVFLFLPGLNKTLITANLVAAACPCAVTASILSAKYLSSREGIEYALQLVVITTLFSLVTIPGMVFLAGLVLGF